VIRVYDDIGRLKEEIDPSRDDYSLHISYVREHPPYHEISGEVAPRLPDDVRSNPLRVKAAQKRAETIRQRKEEANSQTSS
jgi:hypothetical protein